jgi:hypothetical protein
VNAAGNKAETVKIFPNPADNNIYVLFAVGQEEGAEITMIDITGKEVLHKKAGSAQTTLSAAHLPAGMYLIHIQMADGLTQTQKIIIQHR